MAPDAMSQLLDYHWPGNVRELENAVQRAMVVAEHSLLSSEHLSLAPMRDVNHNRLDTVFEGLSLKNAQKIVEKDLITRALEETGSNRTQAAKLLEINHPSLLSKMKTYEIDL